MGKSANFSGMSSELADIVKRLDALEVKMDAVLSPTKIQDFVATFSKLDEVISHLNAGKLEYVFKEASASLETLRISMQDFLVMMREFSSTFQNLDSGSLGK